jgi:hypothetical protein
MCKICAERVQTLSKNRAGEHILYATIVPPSSPPAYKRSLYTKYTQMPTLHFSTQKTIRLPLLPHLFYTEYTGPTTSTTKYINR